MVADRTNRKLLGAHIIAPGGADSIQTAAVAIKSGMTYEQLGEMIFPYLTTVEGLKLAAQTFDKDVLLRGIREMGPMLLIDSIWPSAANNTLTVATLKRFEVQRYEKLL